MRGKVSDGQELKFPPLKKQMGKWGQPSGTDSSVLKKMEKNQPQYQSTYIFLIQRTYKCQQYIKLVIICWCVWGLSRQVILFALILEGPIYRAPEFSFCHFFCRVNVPASSSYVQFMRCEIGIPVIGLTKTKMKLCDKTLMS